MSTKTPSAVIAYTAVPEDAADPVVKTVVNGVETESGGGDSDLTLATVTIDEAAEGFPILAVDANEEYGVVVYALGFTGTTFNTPLYKGKATLLVMGGNVDTVTIEGDATWEHDAQQLNVTGDFTIKSFTVAEA